MPVIYPFKQIFLLSQTPFTPIFFIMRKFYTLNFHFFITFAPSNKTPDIISSDDRLLSLRPKLSGRVKASTTNFQEQNEKSEILGRQLSKLLLSQHEECKYPVEEKGRDAHPT
jgi:hypothetical protein